MDIREIIKRGGGATKVAEDCGITHPSVCVWTRVPPNHVRAVARLTGIPSHELRPDLFDPPGGAEGRAA